MPPQSSRLTAAERAELRRRDTQTEAILAQLSGQVRPIPSHKSARPSREGESYDYNAAIDAGYGPDTSGHWPSDYKLSGHPNTVVGGFHTVTAKRVPGTRRLYGDDLVAAGWDKKTVKELDAVPEPIVSPVPSHTTPAPDAYQGQLNDVLLGGPDAAMRAPTPSERGWGKVARAGDWLQGPLKLALGGVGLDPGLWADRRLAEANEDRQYQAQTAGLTKDEIARGIMAGTVEPPMSYGVMADLPGLGGGFLSRLDAAIDLIPVKGAHPNKVASLLSRASKEELEHRGVPAFLAAQGNTPVTREALRTHLQAHPAPFPQVKRLGGETKWTQEQAARLDELEGLSHLRTGADDVEFQSLIDMENAANPGPGIPETTKYSQYQVPGGTNYRETVLTLPGVEEALPRGYRVEQISEGPQAGLWQMFDDKGYPTGFADRTRQGAVRSTLGSAVIDTPVERGIYRSPHFDEPNVLVHTRSNERTLPTGERGRFLEEVQSDWHQAGKAKGYQSDTPRLQWDKASDTLYEANTVDGQLWVERQDAGWFGGVEGSVYTAPHATREAAEAELMSTMRDNFHQATFPEGVPDAPFKDSWPDLGFKQQLLEVADDPTLDWIGWTSGKTQAARYDLSKQVDRINIHNYGGGSFDVDVIKGGRPVGGKANMTLKDVEGYVGKDLAKKAESQPVGPASYAGLDLQVGGEGMVEFYDRLLPKRVAKIVKPFGGTVEQVSLGRGRPKQWIVRLTPEMKAKMKQGLPLLALPAGVQVSASRPEED
jgi:hypothetical protein